MTSTQGANLLTKATTEMLWTSKTCSGVIIMYIQKNKCHPICMDC